MFFPFHAGFVLCSPSVLALGSFSVKSQTDITAKLQRWLEFRHWKAQSRYFSVSYQKILLDWGVGLLSEGLQLPMFSWKFWHRIREVSHLNHLLLRGSYQQSNNQFSDEDVHQRHWVALLCSASLQSCTSSCLSSPSCFASVPLPVEPLPHSQDRLVNCLC